ncbi:BbrUII/HgiDII family restriction enzyme [Microvirga lotononidis]|uniref:Molecular chaperone of HSP90 family n=1 Tax=Microvirga lotononidis TaxID=864069 RepID=I4Z2K4_9HYPH|nr:ATP-binding protein [Microvirga lotononidis]EIM30446.1 molecular chaperone of HSP90 family [Microvirga lotononidis]WQO26288.1 ATP-binding protein [Microvirga lotononidis]
MSPNRFSLTISLNVLEHLGINLYSNVPSVLSEIVANAWDADAETVEVTWDRAKGRIVIFDDGTGMTAQEVNDRFLKVGHRRRDVQPGLTAKGRHPMGRKGIGKLSLFSIAGTVEIETSRDGEKSAFRMRLEDIRQKVQKEGGTGTYEPTDLSTDSIDFDHGTRITLTDLRHRQTTATSMALRKRVARRFSVLGDAYNFKVVIDGKEVVPADRDYYNKLQYVWTYGEQTELEALATHAEVLEKRTSSTANQTLAIAGWLGTVKESRQLRDEEGDNLNRIAIFVRGKMAQEDILADFSERGVYASYLIGELRVEGLDIYDGPGTERDDDAATSSRQKLVEDDERYQELKAFIGTELKHIQNRWADLRAEDGAKKALEIPAVQAWMSGLKPAVRTKARKWLGKLNRIKMDDVNEQKQLIKHAVLGFEFYRLHENLEALDNISDDNLLTALEVFQELDGLEANLYGQIVQQRIKVIRTLQEKVDENALEKAIQQYLFDHLWLLDPSWERAEGTQVMETRVQTMFKDVTAELTDEERQGRLDIGYRKAAGEHVIIELKRPDRVLGRSEMLEQSEKYLSGMLRLLEAQGTPHEPVEIVFVLGKEPREWKNPDGKQRTLSQLQVNRTRIVFYDQLLTNAEKAYNDYLAHRGVVDTLGQVIAAIEDYAPSASSEESGPVLAITSSGA